MKQPNDMEVPELKALAYDLIIQVEQGQNNLRQINQLIAQKLQEPVKPIKKAESK